MIDILRLVSDLKAGAAHAKVHTIHVNLTWEGLALGGICHVGVLVLENRHLNVDLGSAALIDRLGQAKEAWMRTRCLLRNEVLMCMLIRSCDAILICSLDIAPDFVIG